MTHIRREKEEMFPFPSGKTPAKKNAMRGMTLVELLTVVVILIGLLAVSAPFFKPLLESRQTQNAAQVLAAALQQARMTAIKEQRTYGLAFIPFENAPAVSLQLRLQKENVSFSVNTPDCRVIINNGKIEPVYWYVDKIQSPSQSKWLSKSELTAMIGDTAYSSEKSTLEQAEKLLDWEMSKMRSGYKIQFGHQGRIYVIGSSGTSGVTLAAPYDHLTLPESFDPANRQDAMDFRVTPPPISVLAPQTVMPKGTIVDLVFSGGETKNFDGTDKTAPFLDKIPVYFHSGDEITVMFAPTGSVDAVYIAARGTSKRYLVNEMLYFCVGHWDRQIGDVGGTSLADDGKNNLEVPTTYWVTIHPKTGEVRIAENFPDNNLSAARKFAREHFVNIGGE